MCSRPMVRWVNPSITHVVCRLLVNYSINSRLSKDYRAHFEEVLLKSDDEVSGFLTFVFGRRATDWR